MSRRIRLDIGGPKGNAYVIMGTVHTLCRMEGRNEEEAKDICARMRGDTFLKLGGQGNSYEDLLQVFKDEFPYVEIYATYDININPDLYTIDEHPEIYEL